MNRPLKVAVSAAAGLIACGIAWLPVGGGAPAEAIVPRHVTPMRLSHLSPAPPARPLRLLFIHHSVGGALMAPLGPDKDTASCIWESHPAGGNLRQMLTDQGYEVHEASYGSEIGEKTDLFDWLPKFRDKGDKLLKVDKNDAFFADDRAHHIVMFKSCYPNNDFVGEGTPPGNPAGPELTYWNARATLTALLPELAKRPDVLYVYVTAPPRAPIAWKEPVYKLALKRVLGRPTTSQVLAQQGALARRFNDWVTDESGWLKGYSGKNVVVFDLYDTLTDHGASNLSRYATDEGTDSHPSRDGNAKTASALVPFLNRAVRRAGLSP